MMASDGGYNSVDLTWSSCSRQQLLTFFRWVNLFRVINPKNLTLLNLEVVLWNRFLYFLH